MRSSELQNSLLPTTEHFVTKLGMVMQHHEPECLVKKIVCCLQGEGDSKGSFDQNMTLSTISYELLIPWQQTWSEDMSS